VDRDHIYRPDCSVESLSKLPPAFQKDGIVTAGNSSPLTDGASCMVVMDRELALELECEILGRVAGFAAVGGDPQIMGMGPYWSTKKLLEKTGLTMDSVQQRDTIANQIAAMEAQLENHGSDGTLRNQFVDRFKQYTEVQELTGEIITDVLDAVYIYPGSQVRIVWNFRDEFEKLMPNG